MLRAGESGKHVITATNTAEIKFTKIRSLKVLNEVCLVIVIFPCR